MSESSSSSSSAASSTSTAKKPSDRGEQEATAAAFHRNPVLDESCSDGGDSTQPPFNPTVDLLAEGIVGLLRPSLEGLDTRVQATRAAQDQLRAQIAELSGDLEVIQRAEAGAGVGGREAELETAIEKLNNAKKRVVVVANLLQGAQDRLNRVHHNCLKETARRGTQLEPSASTPEASSVAVQPPSAK